MTQLDALRERIAEMARDARKAADDDDAHWTREACGQDTEEAEESGALIARADTLAEVLSMLDAAARA